MSVDPFTFEVVRHRLWSIDVEGALALQRVSGSPLATEAFDMNTSIMSATGEVAFVGPYLLTGPTSQGMIVRAMLASGTYPVEPGDIWLCNDPYVGAAHQNCVTLVGPIHVDGHLVAWAGATLHVVDVGGSVAGQVGIGATSIHDEAPPIPPLRVVQGGVLESEAEASYVGRSRTPELNALDLRAKIAAINAIAAGVRDVARRHGTDVLVEVIHETIERATRHIRARVAQLPDGHTLRTAYVDRQAQDGSTVSHAVELALEKRGEDLVLDFTGSSAQAPAVINCTRSGLVSGVLVGLLTTLVWDAPWCPAALERVVTVRSSPGTVVDAAWPAGCSMATMAAGFAATTTTAVAVGDLLARDPVLADRAMAAWAGAVGSVDVFGSDRHGARFGTVLLDTMASGTGATSAADGIDTGGFLRSMACVVANVEHTESLFPLLYLYRRQEPDTGGPGRRRGGVGASYAIVPQGVERIDMVSPHFSGVRTPESAGLAGAFPGATNAARLVPGSGVRARFASGRGISGPDELPARGAVMADVARASLGSDDVFEVVTTGGGGFGDPIERGTGAVAMDVRVGLVTIGEAERVYGVRMTADGSPDITRTAARRDAIRAERLRRAGSPPDDLRPSVDGLVPPCDRCGHGPEADAPEHAGPAILVPLAEAGPNVGTTGDGPFVLRQRVCAGCGRSLAIDRISTGGH